MIGDNSFDIHEAESETAELGEREQIIAEVVTYATRWIPGTWLTLDKIRQVADVTEQLGVRWRDTVDPRLVRGRGDADEPEKAPLAEFRPRFRDQ